MLSSGKCVLADDHRMSFLAIKEGHTFMTPECANYLYTIWGDEGMKSSCKFVNIC